MLRTLLAVVLMGLFPSQAHKFVDVACELVAALAGVVGGREQFALIVAAVAVVVYVGNRK